MLLLCDDIVPSIELLRINGAHTKLCTQRWNGDWIEVLLYRGDLASNA